MNNLLHFGTFSLFLTLSFSCSSVAGFAIRTTFPFPTFAWSTTSTSTCRRRRHTYSSHSDVDTALFSVMEDKVPKVETTGDATNTVINTNINTDVYVCNVCSEEFKSRNALFRHLRNSECALANGGTIPLLVMKRNDVAISIGYDAYIPVGTESKSSRQLDDDDGYECDAKLIGDLVRSAFDSALEEIYRDVKDEDIAPNSSSSAQDKVQMPGVISSTQSSVAKLRHSSLSQENGVGSVGCVMAISYRHPVKRSLQDEKESFKEAEYEKSLTALIEKVQDHLNDMDMDVQGAPLEAIVSRIDILAAENLPSKSKLHAETDCTQRVYNYLLPLNWLEGGEETGEWWLDTWRDRQTAQESQSQPQSQSQKSSFSFKDGRSYGGLAKAKSPPPNATLRTLKDCLRSAESKRLEKSEISGSGGGKNNNNGDDDNDDDNDNDVKRSESVENLASGRYGVLASKKRRAFHNFADSALKESPANKPSWRVLDRCRITEQLPFTDENGDTHIVLVIAFAGDDFLPQQVRKIIGSAVAMSNGWLPADFIGTATRADRIIETPLAPANLMYFDEAKFHFDQLVRGKNLFDDAAVGMRKNDSFVADIHRNVLERWFSSSSSPQSQMEESSWLHDLQYKVAPRIIDQLNIQDRDSFQHTNNNDQMERDDFILGDVDVEAKYEKSLSILRDIISSGRWPSTSIARSKVIKKGDGDGDAGSDASVNDNDNDKASMDTSTPHGIQSGSFTIINPHFRDRNGVSILENEKVRTPLANDLFPDLVEAIFDFEDGLSSKLETNRPSSSHCAVNRNAQFTPHVDSGRGSGQSLSMIIGLGDYNGGELLVEGEVHNIYRVPLEFDGWKDRHWTAPFQGERYSLVWFTPDI